MKRASALLLAALMLPLPAGADVGTVAAVNRDMDGTPPAGARRALELGNTVVQDELIQTSRIGSGQLMFLDQTTLTVAPNSNIVLDTYVYDPEAQTGDVALTLTKGALRFIGGRISKTTDARVRTPTATIGIRGGMTTVIVGDDGGTEVLFAAGEYVKITDDDGKTITLSRPNAMAEIPPEGNVQFTGLASTEDYEDSYSTFEGSGDGGTDLLTGDGSAGDGTTGDEGTTTASPEERIAAGTSSVEEVNSGVEAGETNQPVSTSGEQPASEAHQLINIDVVTEDPTEDIPVTDVAATLTTIPAGGAVFSPTLGFQSFNSVAEGSLIGTTAGGEIVRIPVPTANTDFLTTLSNGAISTGWSAIQNSANAGLFEFGFTTLDPGFGFTSTLGNVQGFGFADLDNNFFVFQLDKDPSNPPAESGLALLGDASTGQASVLASDNGTQPSTANTAGTYRFEPQFDTTGGGSQDGGETLFVIANGGEARFDHASHALEANGGAVMVADVFIDNSLGAQQSDFVVFAAPLFNDGVGGLRFHGQAVSTNVFGLTRSIAESNVGLFEDASGNTVFGTNENYLVLTSLEPVNSTTTNNFITTTFGNTRTLGGIHQEPDPLVNVLTRQTNEIIVADPFTLIFDTASVFGFITDRSTITPAQIGHAAGFVLCSTGTCGTNFATAGEPGIYSALGTATTLFQHGQNATVDTNTVTFGMILDVNSPSSVQGSTQVGGVEQLTIAGGPRTAYLDERRYAGTGIGTAQYNGTTAAIGNVAFATSDIAGDGSLFGAVPNSTSQFLTWGWWSAIYRTTDNTGAPREDMIHLGTFIVGAPVNEALLPTSGTVTYNGFSVGTVADLNTSTTEVAAGTFGMTYDFEAAQGQFDLAIDNFNFNNEIAVGDTENIHEYAVNASTSTVSLSASGNFFPGAGLPNAATAGHFEIIDFVNDRTVTGIYGGDGAQN